MEIATQLKSGVAVLALAGRFDAQHATNVRRQIDEALRTTSNIVLDLRAVTFMDSAALAVLVQGMKHCRQAEGDLRVCALQEPVKVIFELTRLDRVFHLFPSQDEAVNSFID
jgi:anti-sigma B factor antagonist